MNLKKHSSDFANPVESILQVLGNVVLIPVRHLTKKPCDAGWQRRNLEDMKDRGYLRKFAGKNIGVLLGTPSGGLCTIDIDTDIDVEPFLALNPKLQNTTRTKRVRGCNLWIYIDGDFPSSAKLKMLEGASDRSWGEWRSDGNQTVIHGHAIDEAKGETQPTEYRFVKAVRPIRIRFDEIQWPGGVSFARRKGSTLLIRLNTESCNPELLQSCIPESLHNFTPAPLDSCTAAPMQTCAPTPLHNNKSLVLASIRGKNEAQRVLGEKNPSLARLYEKLVEGRYQAVAHNRNGSLTQLVPFLYRAVAENFVLLFSGHYYDCNRALFNDSREQHMSEAAALLKGVKGTYLESLTEESLIYQELNQVQQDAFRICRDLAFLPEPEREAQTFFLSFEELGTRLGIHPPQAQRILREFERHGLLELVKMGTRRAPGVRGVASIYRWQLQSKPSVAEGGTQG